MNRNIFLVENNVPDVYINESRDFQIVSRLYDLVFQTTRFSIDSMDYISDTQLCNSTLLELLESKVGFFTSKKVTDKTLRKVLSAFPYIIRYKGSKKSIELVLNLFKKITHANIKLLETDDKSTITVVFYDYVSDIELLKELLDYVRPAGSIIKCELAKEIKVTENYKLTDSAYNGTIMNYVDLNENTLSGVVVQTTNPSSDTNYDSNVANSVGFTIISQTGPDESITKEEKQ